MIVGEIAAWTALALAVVLGVLLAAQTRRLGQVERRLRALGRGAGAGAAQMSLEEMISSQGARIEAMQAEVKQLHEDIDELGTAVARSLQRVGLVRYNPFQDTGGDQSFALVLLDQRGDGVAISSLHSRATTRVYAKPLKAGASPHSLSEEETQALKQALE